MVREYISNVNATQDSWVASDPFYYVRIDSINHGDGGIKKIGFGEFEPSETVKVEGEARGSFNWYSIPDRSGSVNMTFTKTLTIDTEGYYLIELMLDKLPKVSQTRYITLTVTHEDLSTDTLYNEKGYRSWEDSGCVARAPITYLTAEEKTFTLTLPKYAKAAWFKISKLTRYEGGKEVSKESETRLDLIDCEFTQNGVNELDTATITVVMKPDYWTEELGANPLAFDLGDHVTISLGESGVGTRPMFGGYVQGWSINDDMTELTINCIDRLWDLKRAVVWRNFYIGTKPTDVNTGSFNYTQFSSINQIARYLATALYEIDYQSITKEYIMYNNFAQLSDVTSLNIAGFDTKWESSFGHPGTCMRLIPGQPGVNYITFFSDQGNAWDATVYSTFTFDYYASGAGVKYPLKFNIEFDMAKDDGTLRTYVVHVNGTTTDTNKTVLTNVQPILNGQWQRIQLDLDELFDAVAPSSHYYIREVRLVGYQENVTVLNRRCSSLYIDNISAFTSISKAPSYKSADSKTALEELQDLCDKCDHVAYIRPGLERYEDTLIVLPRKYYTLPIEINENNVKSISNLEYSPVEWGMVNTAIDTYNIKDKKSINYVKAINLDNDKHYGVIMDHEFYSDVASKNVAQSNCNKKVASSTPYPGFDLTIHGSTLIEPGQYVPVKLPVYHINGVYELTSIVHKIDFKEENFTTDLSFTRPGLSFNKMLQLIKKTNRDLDNIKNTAAYASSGALAAGMETSLGAYSS